MPKETFYNLDSEKKANVEQVALSEFANFGFHGAKVNRIVENSKISKGSFYQYFSDIEDLFIHIVEKIAKKKVEFIASEINNTEEKDFFGKLESMFLSGVKFYNSLSEDEITIGGMLPVIKNLCTDRLDAMKKGADELFFGRLIDEAISNGEIDSNREFVFVLVSNISRQIIQYLVRKNKEIEIGDVFKSKESMQDAIALFTNLLKKGIKKKEDQNVKHNI